MNILHIATSMTWRGGERQVFYLMESLSSENLNQHLLCCSESEIYNRITNKSITVHSKKKSSSISYNWAKEIYKICTENSIDIIHAHDAKSQTLSVLSATIFRNSTSIVLTRRVLFPVKGALSIYKYNHSSIKKIICVSSAVQREINKILKIDNTVLISDSIDTKKFENKVTKNFHLPSDKIKIGYVAALTEEKDHDTFIETAKLILDKRQDVQFYIAGKGKLENKIRNKIEKLELTNEIILMGFITEIDSLISQLDVLLFTSLSEGLGSTILDFFLCKKPVISTQCGGNEDIVIHRETGMLAERKDTLQLANYVNEVISNDALKNHLTENAFKLVSENYGYFNISQKTLEVYNDVLKKEIFF